MDKEKIAHDIAISILPDVVREDGIVYFERNKHNNGETFNSTDIIDLYYTVYEGLLKDL